MERSERSLYESWEEMSVLSNKGRRDVHFSLKRRDGGSDLAVIGREKSSRRMSYKVALRRASALKFSNRDDVVDWLNHVISGFDTGTSSLVNRASKHIQSIMQARAGEEFLWLGSPCRCSRQRKHYRSFQRIGVKICVHDFVHVLSEEGKRLIAHLEDMYEDSTGNKMVTVQWFHKFDEVAAVLPCKFNQREVFFSQSFQDLNLECIDGLATVLSPQHFEELLHEARRNNLDPFVCSNQFENDDIKPFDISLVAGYWNQAIFRYRTTDVVEVKKRRRLNHNISVCDINISDVKISQNDFIGVYSGTGDCSSTLQSNVSSSSIAILDYTCQQLEVGCEVEVLSEDSGIRGCWFIAKIVMKHKNKVTLRYRDVLDAEDKTKLLEETVSLSKIADTDKLGIRTPGRYILRPSRKFNDDMSSFVVNVGTIVDAWWHDGWWEGIVAEKKSEDSFIVFFPGENRKLVFTRAYLRQSKEWLGNRWIHISERPEIAIQNLRHNERNGALVSCPDEKMVVPTISDIGKFAKHEAEHTESSLDSLSDGCIKYLSSPDISKDRLLEQLKWSVSKRRTHIKYSNHGKILPQSTARRPTEELRIVTKLKVDNENCKYMGDSLFNSSAVRQLPNLVMSR